MQSDVRLKQSALLLDLLALCVAIGFVIGGLIVRGRWRYLGIFVPRALLAEWPWLSPDLRERLAVSCAACGNTQCQRRFLRDYLRPAISRTGRHFRFLADLSVMVSAAAGSKATSVVRLLSSHASAACSLCAELATGAAREYDATRGHAGVFRNGLSLLPCLVFPRTLEIAANGFSNRLWCCDIWIVVCGLAIEAELEPLIGFYCSLPCSWRLWASETPYAFWTIAGRSRCVRAPIRSSPFLQIPKRRAAVFSLLARLYSRPANIGDAAGPGLTWCAQFWRGRRDLLRRTRQGLSNSEGETAPFRHSWVRYRLRPISLRFFSTIMERESWSDRELVRACYSAYFRAWHQAPYSMLKKVWKQIRLFLFPRPGDFYRAAKSIDLNHELAISRSSLGETELSPRVQKIYQSYIQGLETAVGKASRPLGFRFVARLAHYLTWIILPLQVAFFAALIAVYLSRQGRALRLGGLVASAVLGATYGIVLAIGIGHSLDVGRFRVSYAPGFLLGLAMTANYLLIFALATRIPDKQLSETT
jgi:hypothetical protein